VRAQLAALGRVQPALEQGAEDAGVDGAPVQRAALRSSATSGGSAGHGDGLEQPAVEPGHVVHAEQAAVAHGGEQLPGPAAQPLGLVIARLPTRRSNMRPGSRPTSSAKKQNRHWVRKWATVLGVVAAPARSLGQRGKAARGGFGDVAVGLARA
jgi:hypothetical protein